LKHIATSFTEEEIVTQLDGLQCKDKKQVRDAFEDLYSVFSQETNAAGAQFKERKVVIP